MRFTIFTVAAAIASVSANVIVGRQDTTATSATSTTSSVEIITGQPSSQPSGQPPVTAPAGSLPLGAICSDTRQCANDAQCWGTTAFTIRRCGNFNAACTTTSQCAYNTCNNGLCNGVLLPPANSTSVYPTGGTITATATGTGTGGGGGYSPTATGGYSATPTPSVPIPYTGIGAKVESGLFGFAALIAGVAAWMV